MRRQNRTRRVIATGYWIFSIVALTGFAAWRFEWITFEGTVPSLVATNREPEPDNTPHTPDQLPVEDFAGDPAVFSGQKEPAAAGDAYQGAAMIGRTSPVPPQPLVASGNLEPAGASPMPGRIPATTETTSAATPVAPAGTATPPAAAPSAAAPAEAVVQAGVPAARKPLGSTQPDEWDGQGAVQQASNTVHVSNTVQQASNEVESTPGRKQAEFDDPFGQTATSAQPAANVPPEVKAIDAHIAAGKYLDAHRELSKLYWNRVDLRPVISDRINLTAQSIYFSPQPHYMEPYVVQSNDQLRLVSDKYRVPHEYLAKLNRIDPRKIRPEQKLKVIKGPFSAVVDLSDFELTIHAHGYYVKRYAVGTGRENATPLGKFTVLNKVNNPQYTDPDGKVIDANDPSNPLGDRWIDLGDSYGIHGTIDPGSIGKAESRGCIRMRNEDVAEVYDMLAKGSEVLIRQ